jgi:hypothetical protein
MNARLLSPVTTAVRLTASHPKHAHGTLAGSPPLGGEFIWSFGTFWGGGGTMSFAGGGAVQWVAVGLRDCVHSWP